MSRSVQQGISNPRPEKDLETRIREQIEFYFSDSNLPRDEFLKKLYDSNDGWVPLATVASFKKLKQLSEDIAVITEAVKKSILVKLSADGEQPEVSVGRVEPLPPIEELQLIKSHVVFIENLPKEATLEDIQAFFLQPKFELKEIKCVRMQRDRADKGFRGSAFLELESEAEAKKFAEAFNQKTRWFEEESETNPLLSIQTREQLFKARREEEDKKNKDKGGKKETSKKRKAEDELEVPAEGEKKEAAKEEEDKIIPDRIVRLTELDDNLNIILLKKYVADVGADVAFVDYTPGNTTALIRLKDETAVGADAFAKAVAEKKIEIPANSGKVPNAAVVGGDEEAEYWKAFFARRADKKNNDRGGKQFRGKGGRGGRGNFKKQRR